MSITDPCNRGHTHFRNLAQSNPTKTEGVPEAEMLAQRKREELFCIEREGEDKSYRRDRGRGLAGGARGGEKPQYWWRERE
jgi:hypothetical protein